MTAMLNSAVNELLMEHERKKTNKNKKLVPTRMLYL